MMARRDQIANRLTAISRRLLGTTESMRLDRNALKEAAFVLRFMTDAEWRSIQDVKRPEPRKKS